MSKLEDLLKASKKTRGSQKAVADSIIEKRAQRKQESKTLENMIQEYDKIESLKRKFLKDLVKDKKLIKQDLFENRLQKLIKSLPEDDEFNSIVKIVYDYDGNPEKAKNAMVFINDKLNKLDYIDTSSNLQLLELIKLKPNLFSKLDNFKKIYENEIKSHQNLSRQFSSEFEKKRAELIEGKLKDVYKTVTIEMKSIPLTKEEKENIKRNELLRLELLNYIDTYEIDDELFGGGELYDHLINSLHKFDESKDSNNMLFSGILKIVPTVIPSKNISTSNKMYKDFVSKVLSKYNQERDTIVSSLQTVLEDEILTKRYNNVQLDRFNLDDDELSSLPDIKQESQRKTLKNLYGPLEDLISFKKIEKISNVDGVKLVEKEVVVEQKVEERPFKKQEKDIEIDGNVYRPLIADRDLKVKKDLKDSKYVPPQSQKSKTPEEIQNEQLELYEKLDEYFPLYNKNTLLSELNDRDIDILRRFIVSLLKNFFDEKSSIIIEKNLYNENKYSNLSNYIKKLGNIVLFVDEKYMKNFAKLFNERLSNNYFDAESITSLSLKDILYDLYNNSSNSQSTIQKLNDLITKQMKLFEINIMQNLAIEHAKLSFTGLGDNLTPYILFKEDIKSSSQNVNPYIIKIRQEIKKLNQSEVVKFLSNKWDQAPVSVKKYYNEKAENDRQLYQKEEKYSRIKEFNFEEKTGITEALLAEIEPLNVHSCNVDYKGSEQYHRYVKLKREYELKKSMNSDDKFDVLKKLSVASAELAPFLKDIIYYKDDEDKQVYCFNLFDLADQIKNNNLLNPYNNKRLSDDFIEYIRKYKKPSFSEKVEEKSPLTLVVMDNLNKLDMNLKNDKTISKKEICDYYSNYVFAKTSLEIKLNKPEEEMKKLNDYCNSISEMSQIKPKKPKKSKESSVSDIPKNFGFKPLNMDVMESPVSKKIKNNGVGIEMLLRDKSSSPSHSSVNIKENKESLENLSNSNSSDI